MHPSATSDHVAKWYHLPVPC